MTLQDLIQIVSAKLAALNSARATALSLGDLKRAVELDTDIEETQTTLTHLRSTGA